MVKNGNFGRCTNIYFVHLLYTENKKENNASNFLSFLFFFVWNVAALVI